MRGDTLTQRVLRHASDRLTPETWTRGTMARNAAGTPVEYDNDSAVKWCALGSLQRSCKQYEQWVDRSLGEDWRDLAVDAIQAMDDVLNEEFEDYLPDPDHPRFTEFTSDPIAWVNDVWALDVNEVKQVFEVAADRLGNG